MNGAGTTLLEVKHLKKYFPVAGGILRRKVGEVKAVDDISFVVREGETLGLVGESGCGKTTVGRAILRLEEPTAGQALFRSERLAAEGLMAAGTDSAPRAPGAVVDLVTLDRERLKRVRREVQMIFQDPNSSLNPRMTVQQILSEPFLIHALGGSREEIEERIVKLMEQVGLRPEQRSRYPHQFSAGQRQRIGIARALALQPKLVIADEPVSALDVSIQGQVLNLLEDLQEELGLTYVFIAHDMSVVEHISDWVAVMYLGRLVELARSEELYRAPQHPYTEALLSAVQVPDPDVQRKRIILEGGVPSPADPPSGCRFHTRCPYAAQSERMQRCSTEVPEIIRAGDRQWVACHFAAELDLRGVEVPPRALQRDAVTLPAVP